MERSKYLKNSVSLAVAALVLCLGSAAGLAGNCSGQVDLDDFMVRYPVEPNVDVQLVHGDSYVEGFPVIVGVRVIPRKASTTLYLRDFASTFSRSSGFWLLLFSKGVMNEPIALEGMNPRRAYQQGRFVAPDLREVRENESYIMWMDIAQLIIPTNDIRQMYIYPRSGVFPQGPELSLAFYFSELRASSGAITVATRSPNSDESRIIDSLEADGTCRSWFPQAFFRDNPLPESSHLPIETRRIVRLIESIRDALRSSADGLITLDSYSSDDWGYYSELVSMFRY